MVLSKKNIQYSILHLLNTVKLLSLISGNTHNLFTLSMHIKERRNSYFVKLPIARLGQEKLFSKVGGV